MKMLINAGIIEVFYVDGYPDELSQNFINESNITVVKVGSEDKK